MFRTSIQTASKTALFKRNFGSLNKNTIVSGIKTFNCPNNTTHLSRSQHLVANNNYSTLSQCKSHLKGNMQNLRWLLLCIPALVMYLQRDVALSQSLDDTPKTSAELEELYPDLPTYTMEDVAQHTSLTTGLWVVFDGCVYDITEFIKTHPGGDKILSAKGGMVEKYWSLYPIHYKSSLVPEYLDKLRIGILSKADREKALEMKKEIDANSPFKNEPTRHPLSEALQTTPYNGGVPSILTYDQYITPNDLWFTRNHHPVPLTDEKTYQLTIQLSSPVWTSMQNKGYALINGVICYQNKPVCTPVKPVVIENDVPTLKLSLDELRNVCGNANITSTIVCAGNRRSEFNTVEPTDGLSWSTNAASNAVWTGPRLSTILQQLGITESNAEELNVSDVVFTGLDNPFDASIPANKALTYTGDVLLAHTMNDATLPRDHGYPVRALVPGYTGVRNVKWLEKVTVSHEEATSPWQRGPPYKGFSPYVKDFKDVDTFNIPSVYAMPVMSVISHPSVDLSIEPYPCPERVQTQVMAQRKANRLEKFKPTSQNTEPCDCIDVSGWAYSGGGRGIVRVDLTTDAGMTWVDAEITEGPKRRQIENNTAWAWSLWTAAVPVPEGWKNGDTVTVAAKAVDSAYNSQPESMIPIWNRRGILNNNWHKATYTLKQEDE